MKIREHRGLLSESMETTEEIDRATIDDVIAWVREKYKDTPVVFTNPFLVKVERYGYDNRINEDIHIVTVEGQGVLGFTDGPVRDKGIRNE